MIRPKLILCADYVLLDSQTNSVTAFSIIEDITPEGFPVFLPRFSILSVLERDPEDPDSIVTKVDVSLDDQSVYSAEGPIEFQGKKRSRHITILGGLPIPKPGVLSATISTEGRELHRYVIEVNPSRAQPQVREQSAPYG